jgi:type I restriction-modification system DNA methylase subunit
MIMNDFENYSINNKDVYNFSLQQEEKYDYVLMDPPLSLTKSLELDRVLKYGVPSRHSADWANIQLGLYVCKNNGRVMATTALGSLSRSSDLKIRKEIIEANLVEAVIVLPSNLYVNTAIPVAILVFNKQAREKEEIAFIDLTEYVNRKNRKQNTVTEEGLEIAYRCITKGIEYEGVSSMVSLGEVRDRDYNLNSTYYIKQREIDSNLGKSIELSDVAKVMTGVNVSKAHFEELHENATHYYLNVKDIAVNSIAYHEETKIRARKTEWRNKYEIQAGDVILTTKGTTLRATIVPDKFNRSFISSNLTIIRVNPKRYDPYVLWKFLLSELGQTILESITTGSTISMINAKVLRGIQIPDFDHAFMNALGQKIKSSEEKYRERMKLARNEYEREDKAAFKLIIESNKNELGEEVK